MKLVIEVTQNHIDCAKPGSPNSCAIALAVKELFTNNSTRVSVSHRSLSFYKNFEIGDNVFVSSDYFEVEHGCGVFVLAFDAEEKVKPFTKVIELDKYEVVYLENAGIQLSETVEIRDEAVV